MIRLFRIVGNKQKGIGSAEYVNLNDFNKYLITLPENLGISIENTYINVGNERLRVDQKRDFQNITGTIEVSGNTRDDWEKNYDALRDFVAINKPYGFKLYYKNREQVERYIECDLKLFNKSEKSSYCILVPLELQPRSMWQQDGTVDINIEYESVSENETVFDADDEYSFGFLYNTGTLDWDVAFVGENIYGAEVLNNSDDELPAEITIYGEAVNPLIQLLDVNDNVIQACKIYDTIEKNERIVINSDISNLSILKYTKDGKVYNITNKRNVEMVSFIRIPVGNYEIKVQDDNQNAIAGTVKFIYKYYGG